MPQSFLAVQKQEWGSGGAALQRVDVERSVRTRRWHKFHVILGRAPSARYEKINGDRRTALVAAIRVDNETDQVSGLHHDAGDYADRSEQTGSLPVRELWWNGASRSKQRDSRREHKENRDSRGQQCLARQCIMRNRGERDRHDD